LKVVIGKVVKSYSHINYVCQIYGPLEVEVPPHPSDYAFGQFVRVAGRSRLLDESRGKRDTNLSSDDEPCCYTVGVIYDTRLLNPTFGSLGPRLSTETQVELFSPDYLSERAVLVHVIMLGAMEQLRLSSGIPKTRIVHGVPADALALDSSVETMTDEEVHLFPQQRSLLSMLKRNFAWRMKVETTG
jgi:hypothetical protein